jgi:phage shock protein C
MPKKLYRSRTECMIAGVCGGLAEYFNVDATLVRLAAVALTLAWGTGIFAYLIFWFAVPQRPLELAVTDKESEAKAAAADSEDEEPTSEASNAGLFAGVILVVIGFLFLLGNFVSLAWLTIGRLWPLILIAIGLVIILKRSGRRDEG